MANRVKRKREARLELRIKRFEEDSRKPGKHEHHKPGSQSGRK